MREYNAARELLTKTCRCREAQLVFVEIRWVTDRHVWVYRCPKCGAEGVARWQIPGRPDDGAPIFEWLLPSEDEGDVLPGRVLTPSEAEAHGDCLADSTARDHNGQRVTLKGW